jgi:hypothetical protein
MSVVTNLILTFSSSEYENEIMKKVNSYKYRDIQMNLASIDYNKDGKKV